MKENADKYLDDLSRKVIGKSAIESPSFDFTKNVMSQIEPLQSSVSIRYVPLISKRMWLLLSVGIASLIGYIIFGSQNHEIRWLEHIKLESYINFINTDSLSAFNVSQTMCYIALLFAIMLAIQIPLLKHQLDKRFK
ncbi:hypothetical protein [Psychroserpens mesophilus]|uniref:hypothetical protein n=1 Tax=Psychroserpens mesophilus TaxID=325473 RepID=UPI003D651BFA